MTIRPRTDELGRIGRQLSIDMRRILSETHPISAPRPLSSLASWPALLAALAGAAILIYWLQAARPLWVDEEMLALNARDRGFAELRGPLWLDQSAPLGWLALERIALATFGRSEPAARALNTVFGLLTLATAVWIGRRWLSAAAAAVLVLLCAFGEWLVFFTMELKHYSADTFGALLVPALAAWALEAPHSTTRDASATTATAIGRRIASWWLVAAVALWFSNGALFVTPAVAAALVAIALWRRDWIAARWTIAGGMVWLVSFALAYVLLLRHALDNPYLKNYWAFAFPPTTGAADTIRWIGARFEPLAVKPAGTALWLPFWLAAAAGLAFAVATGRTLGVMIATVPASALALAIFRIVPPFERLVLWMVPAVYVAIALCADAAVWLARRARTRPVAWIAPALAAGTVAAAVAGDVVQRGVRALEMKPMSNYGLDDRRSIAWLLSTLRPGDVVMTTHFGLAGLWWYGNHDISDAERAGRLPDDIALFEIGHEPSASACATREQELQAVLRGRSRVVVYLGFRLNVLPPGFDYLVLEDFGRRGDLVGYRRYAEESRVAVFDLTRPPRGTLVIPGESTDAAADAPRAAAGCVTVAPAARW